VQPRGLHWCDGAPFPDDGVEHPAIQGGPQRLPLAGRGVHEVARATDHVEFAVASDRAVPREVGDRRREDGEEAPSVGERVVGLPDFLRRVAAHAEPFFLRAQLFPEAEKLRRSDHGVPGFAHELQGVVLRERQPS
jgi:hypothetical protein